jgi:hypothetical protein
MRGGVFGFLALVVGAAAVADVLAHPAGTKAAGNALSGLLKTSLQASAGQKIT